MLALIVSLVFAIAASGHDAGQIPTSPWKKAAPFPEPDEELYGAALNGKMYVIGGWDEGKAAGINYEYDPATDKWTQKKGMPRAAHHSSEEHTSELQSPYDLVCRLRREKKKQPRT